MATTDSDTRTLGLAGAVGVGVGAIVGGGILALAGVAFATTGPSTILAFALNGVVAFLTVLSFSELASRFPQSGGTYTYARKVLTVEAAFAVGWVVWFASVVAAVLYALGFAVFLVPFLEEVLVAAGTGAPPWIASRFALASYALGALGFYTWSLSRTASGGGAWATIGKVVVFGVLLAGGFWVWITDPPTSAELGTRFRPFFENGGAGLAQAMGYTFIALQGFDLIAAVGGEVKDPERTIPRAMMLSLGLALAIYLPLLVLIVAVGVPEGSVASAAASDPEILIAVAARNFLGPTGYWLVLVAGLLSMLSAMQANLMAASHFARTMAKDRTLPPLLAVRDGRRGTPVAAIRLTAIVVAFLIVAVPDLAAAGAVSSLIFLASFALTHAIAYLARHRTGDGRGFRAFAFPLVPLVGGGACAVLGIYQALAVPSAGSLTALWLSGGAGLYALYLAPRARSVDAASEGRDPSILQLRGRKPVVLVPIANPASAETLVTMAESLAPRGVSHVQLLSVVVVPQQGGEATLPRRIEDAQSVLGGALRAATQTNLRPEARITLCDDPWSEIARVAEASRCDKLLLGVGQLDGLLMVGPLEELLGKVSADVAILRAPPDWSPRDVKKILVPSRGGRTQSPVRARLLGNLCRTGEREVTYLSVVPESTSDRDVRRLERNLRRLGRDEVDGSKDWKVVLRDDLIAEVAEQSADADLLILGLHRDSRRQRIFGRAMLEIADATRCPLLMISQTG